MLTLYDIGQLAYPTTLDKGVSLFDAGNVVELDYWIEDDAEYAVAQVLGSGKNIYEVNIKYDLGQDRLAECRCECPAFTKYDGLCKHCVAALLEYVEENREYEEEKYILRSTTPAIKKLLLPSYRQIIKPHIQDVMPGTVHLEPHVYFHHRKIGLEFKIGSGRRYILNDLSQFSNDLKNQSRRRYGKQLAFIHDVNAFDDESKVIADYICRTVESGRANFEYGYQNRRTLVLDIDGLAEFLGTVKSGHIFGWFSGYEEPLEICSEKVPRRMRIESKDNGLEIKLDYLEGFAGERYFIYVHDGKVYVVDNRTIESIKDFLVMMSRFPDRTIFIEKEDIGSFCRQLLPSLEEHYQVDKIDFDEGDYVLEQATFSIYMDLSEKDTVTCRIMADYEDEQVNIYSNEKPNIRDIVTESKVNRAVASFFNGFDHKSKELLLSNDEDRLYHLLVSGMAVLETYGKFFVTDRLKNINIIGHTTVKVGVSIESDLLELSFDSGDMSREQLLEILSNYNPKKKYYRMKSGDFINVENDELEILHELKNGLNLSDKLLALEKIQLPKYRALYIDEQLKKGHSIPTARDKSYKELIRNFKTIEENEFDIPVSLDGILREYQKSGFLWLKTLHSYGFGGILADDMGLGKTLQVISFLKSESELREDMKKTLIVCPSSLVYNWKSEFEKFAPSLSVTTVTGLPEERRQLIEAASEGDILITSYDLLKSDVSHYSDGVFGYQVIDEAQYIKNHATQASKAVKAVAAGFKLALTGTPIENRLSELWSVFDYLMPGFLYPYSHFKSEMEIPIVQNQDPRAMSRLKQMVSPFVLRRLKRDVLTDLPDKIEENVVVPIEDEQRKIYNAHVVRLKSTLSSQTSDEFNVSKIKVLSELTRLRQICCDPRLVYENFKDASGKVEICLDLLQEAVEGGHKVLLFSQFTSMLKIIQNHLDEMGISYFTLTGETSKEKRLGLVEAFNQDDTSVFCISLKAGGIGLNLTSADIVIHFDPWWNVAAQNQATDRAHRIGQKNVVNVYRLIAKDTIEEKIIRLQESKRELADQVLAGESIGSSTLTKEELLEILG